MARAAPVSARLAPHAVAEGRVAWIVAYRPVLDSVAAPPPADWTAAHRGAWARAGPPIAAVEEDTLLRFVPVGTRDSTSWFGPRFTEFAVAFPDSWPAARHVGIPLTGWWRRTALRSSDRTIRRQSARWHRSEF